MKQYKMPLILGSIAWVLAGLSLIIGIIDLVQHGVNKNTYFAAAIVIGGGLSGVNLLRLHRQLKYRKPPDQINKDMAAGAHQPSADSSDPA